MLPRWIFYGKTRIQEAYKGETLIFRDDSWRKSSVSEVISFITNASLWSEIAGNFGIAVEEKILSYAELTEVEANPAKITSILGVKDDAVLRIGKVFPIGQQRISAIDFANPTQALSKIALSEERIEVQDSAIAYGQGLLRPAIAKIEGRHYASFSSKRRIAHISKPIIKISSHANAYGQGLLKPAIEKISTKTFARPQGAKTATPIVEPKIEIFDYANIYGQALLRHVVDNFIQTHSQAELESLLSRSIETKERIQIGSFAELKEVGARVAIAKEQISLSNLAKITRGHSLKIGANGAFGMADLASLFSSLMGKSISNEKITSLPYAKLDAPPDTLAINSRASMSNYGTINKKAQKQNFGANQIASYYYACLSVDKNGGIWIDPVKIEELLKIVSVYEISQTESLLILR